MKDIILRVSLFCFILFLQLVFFSFLFIPKNNTKEAGMYNANAYGFLGEPANTIDVLVVGDSESYANISPLNIYQEYGFTSYIAGTPGQLINKSYEIVLGAFNYQKPKVVILEANNVFRDLSLDQFGKSLIKKYLPLFLYHNRWKNITLRDFNFKVEYTWTNELKGYNYSTKVKPVKNDDYMKNPRKDSSISSLNYYYLNKIRELCEREGIEFVLINTPNHKNWNQEKHDLVSEYAKQYHIDYLDMNVILDEVGIDWSTDTRDAGDHLNYQGAAKVSEYLGNYLSVNYNLPNHRDDSNYASWEKDLSNFMSKVQSQRQLHNSRHD